MTPHPDNKLSEPVRENRRWPRWAYVAATIAAALVGWGAFHPDFRPDVQLVSPAIRNELGKTGFKSVQGVTSARYESIELQDGSSTDYVSRQKIVAIDALITEKRGRRHTKALTQEVSGLYVGPIAVVRYWRNWPPLIGELLPYHFWTSSRMSEIVVEHAVDFPHSSAGRLLAKITYENQYGDGASARTERIRLRCDVKNVVEAASVNARLSGSAARIDCMELVQADPDAVSSNSQDSPIPDYTRYSHWYVMDRGWSIPIEGEEGFRVGELAIVNQWRSKLVSFD